MKCSNCGSELQAGERVCTFCGQALEEPKAQRKENVVTGIVGALIGALIGGASIILISQLGYIASVSGLILAVCTLKGYELLGGKLSTKGIVISLILVLVTPFLADTINWALMIKDAFSDPSLAMGGELTLLDGIIVLPVLLAEEPELMGEYVKNLLMIYGFVALGAFATLRNAFKK